MWLPTPEATHEADPTDCESLGINALRRHRGDEVDLLFQASQNVHRDAEVRDRANASIAVRRV
jgi:hypothetical protein